MDYRFCAQPDGVEVWRGEAEIGLRFADADQYGDLANPATVTIELDTQTARHLAERLLAATPTEEQEMRETAGPRIKLPRTGKRALAVAGGEQIAEASSQQIVGNGPLQNRWHELAVYQTPTGKLVLTVGYRTRWEGESPHDSAEVFGDAAGVATYLAHDYDPLEHVAGFPTGDEFSERQRRLDAAIRTGYGRAVSELLAALPGAEEVVE